jgi:hypothetical protein
MHANRGQYILHTGWIFWRLASLQYSECHPLGSKRLLRIVFFAIPIHIFTSAMDCI